MGLSYAEDAATGTTSMPEIAAQSSIELHRGASTKDKAAEYQWTTKIYVPPWTDLSQVHHTTPPEESGQPYAIVTWGDYLIAEHERLDAEMLKRFGPKDQVAVIQAAFEAGREHERQLLAQANAESL